MRAYTRQSDSMTWLQKNLNNSRLRQVIVMFHFCCRIQMNSVDRQHRPLSKRHWLNAKTCHLRLFTKPLNCIRQALSRLPALVCSALDSTTCYIGQFSNRQENVHNPAAGVAPSALILVLTWMLALPRDCSLCLARL
jgi:hypothetical protein